MDTLLGTQTAGKDWRTGEFPSRNFRDLLQSPQDPLWTLPHLGSTAWEIGAEGFIVTKAHITGNEDSLELLATAARLDFYTSINTKRLRSFELYSPAATPLVVEDNAQNIGTQTR